LLKLGRTKTVLIFWATLYTDYKQTTTILALSKHSALMQVNPLYLCVNARSYHWWSLRTLIFRLKISDLRSLDSDSDSPPSPSLPGSTPISKGYVSVVYDVVSICHLRAYCSAAASFSDCTLCLKKRHCFSLLWLRRTSTWFW